MRPSPPDIQLLSFVQFSLAHANLIQANAANFYVPGITIRPTLNIRNPNFPETATMPASPAQLLQQNSACVVLGEAIDICNTLNPGFNTLQPTAQAHCLCYSSTSWMPEIFDNAVKTCADYASTAVFGAYQPLANLEGFCQSIGDVETSSAAFTITTIYQTIPTSMGMSMSAFSGQPCNSVNSMLNDCSSSFNGFWGLQPQDRAKCLCYVSTSSWCPTAFDNAVQTCEAYAQAAAPSLYSSMTTLRGFCASVGDVLATTPASYSVATTLTAIPSPLPTSGPQPTKGTSTGGGSRTMEIATTITIGGVRNTETAKSSGIQVGKMSAGQVVAFSFLCSLLVLFL
ncbi:hypothetical protein N431DRAFT_547634 [Stipitochalara longipes BDJ]|nr:hypothetical protein N431DRAFT_547634 [Stipitochalara longipes BDJ]